MGRMCFLAPGAGAGTIQCPVMKGPGYDCCSERQLRAGSTMLGPVNKTGEAVELSSWTLGKIKRGETYHFFVSEEGEQGWNQVQKRMACTKAE